MRYGKIVAGGSLENIMGRLNGLLALLYLLHESAEANCISEDAVGGLCDLLETICRDFQAGIDAAEDYVERGAGV